LPFDLPGRPLDDPAWVFALIMALILFVPVLAARARVPAVVGLVVAGTLVGPHVLVLLERDGAVALLGSAGLLYLMLVAGLELDLEEFRARRRDSVVFGAATFVIPISLGTAVSLLLGFSPLAALLIGSAWASHTLVAYPIFQRHGTARNRAVAVAVGATILTDTAALLVLAGVAGAERGDTGLAFWAGLAGGLAMLLLVTFVLLPRLARRFFAGLGQDRSARFLFVLVALFGVSGLAQLAGIEAIVGAFLAGLALNPLVAERSLLMDRIRFLGDYLLIPIFLISVGMLIDPRVLLDPEALGFAAAFVGVATGSKALAALASGRLLGYSWPEIGSMFALSNAQAAATLAAMIVGLQVGLISVETVNAVVVVILVTCLTASWVASRAAPRLPHPAVRRRLGETVVVPLVRPESARPLVWVAAAMARPDSGTVVPLRVLPPESDAEQVDACRGSIISAESVALGFGADATGMVRIDASPAAGVNHTIVEHGATLAVLGWKGRRRTRGEALFGDILDTIVAGAVAPVLIGRLRDLPPGRIVVAVAATDLAPGAEPSLQLALETARRLRGGPDVEVLVVSQVEDGRLAERVSARLGTGVVRDQRSRSVALRSRARPDDLVIVPVSPDRTGLRRISATLVRAAPDSSVLVAYDRGVTTAVAPMAASDQLLGPPA
jgi:Kef-type K+ transport system membrane component KefB